MMEDDHDKKRHMLTIDVMMLGKNGVGAEAHSACLGTSKVVHWFLELDVLKNPGFGTIQD